MKKRVTAALISIMSRKVYVKACNGYFHINEGCITLVMHLKDIQRVLLRYITMILSGIITRIICNIKMVIVIGGCSLQAAICLFVIFSVCVTSISNWPK